MRIRFKATIQRIISAALMIIILTQSSIAFIDTPTAMLWPTIDDLAKTTPSLMGAGTTSLGFFGGAFVGLAGLAGAAIGGLMATLVGEGLDKLYKASVDDYSKWYETEDWERQICSNWGGIVGENNALASSNVPKDSRLRVKLNAYKTTLPDDTYAYEFTLMIGHSDKNVTDLRVTLIENDGTIHGYQPGASSNNLQSNIGPNYYARTYDYIPIAGEDAITWNASRARLTWKIDSNEGYFDTTIVTKT